MAYSYEYPNYDPAKYNDDWLIRQVLDIKSEWEQYFPEWKTNLEQQNALIAQIKQELDQIVELSPAFLENLISNAIKNVWFGLNDAGYFVAYVPSSWADVQFRTTGLDFDSLMVPQFGHLVVEY